MTRSKKKNWKSKAELVVIVLVIVFVFWWFVRSDLLQNKPERKDCPYAVLGNQNATLVIKYFESPSCIWCAFEDNVFQKVLPAKGQWFRLEKYDLRNCNQYARSQQVFGPPGFVFLQNNESVVRHGFIGISSFEKVICDLVPESCL